MSPTPTVVALCGSMRDGSYTRVALRDVLDAADAAGAETELLDVREYDLPVFDPDEAYDDPPGDVEEVKRIIREADAVAWGSPVYHGSYSSAFRNVHDYCGWDEYEDTTVGLLATAGGGTFSSTLDHMRVTARGVHAWVLPQQVGVRNASDKIEDGEILDADVADRVETLGEKLVEYAFIEPTVPGEQADADGAAADD